MDTCLAYVHQEMCSVANSGRILAYLIRKCVMDACLAYVHQEMCSVSNIGRILAYFDQEMGSKCKFGLC